MRGTQPTVTEVIVFTNLVNCSNQYEFPPKLFNLFADRHTERRVDMEYPEVKRKKYFTKEEIIEKLKDHNQKVDEVVKDICEELTPFDINDADAVLLEDRLERLDRTSKNLTAKVYRLKSEIKSRKYRNHPEQLKEKEISCSQYSVLQSQSSEDLFDSPDMEFDSSPSVIVDNRQQTTDRPDAYTKKPLNELGNSYSRSRRVQSKREELSKWAAEEGVSVSQLLGYLLYMDNYHTGGKIVIIFYRHNDSYNLCVDYICRLITLNLKLIYKVVDLPLKKCKNASFA